MHNLYTILHTTVPFPCTSVYYKEHILRQGAVLLQKHFHLSLCTALHTLMPLPYISVCYSNCTNPECLVIARAEQSGLSWGFDHLQRVDDPNVTRKFSYLLHGLDIPHLGR